MCHEMIPPPLPLSLLSPSLFLILHLCTSLIICIHQTSSFHYRHLVIPSVCFFGIACLLNFSLSLSISKCILSLSLSLSLSVFFPLSLSFSLDLFLSHFRFLTRVWIEPDNSILITRAFNKFYPFFFSPLPQFLADQHEEVNLAGHGRLPTSQQWQKLRNDSPKLKRMITIALPID